jgi:transposase
MLLVDRQALREHTTTSSSPQSLGQALRVSLVKPGAYLSESYQAFLRTILAQTTAHLCLIHDGARYHTSQATRQFLAQHAERLTVHPLPSYSPDDNPIAYLWKKTKKRATHNQYFKELALLIGWVEKALAYFATHPATGLGLCGRHCEESGLELEQAA